MDKASEPARLLEDRTVLVTRSKRQAGSLSKLLAEAGARVLEVPAIEIVLHSENLNRLKQCLQEIHKYSWLLLTSVNSVAILDDVLKELGLGWTDFANLRIACIGRATAGRVRGVGGSVSVIPEKFQAESLVEALAKEDLSGKRILLPRAEGSRPLLPDELSRRGAIVDELHIYRAELPESSREELSRILQNHPIDFITFTSSSTVHHFVEMAGDLLSKINFNVTRLASIGPITTATLKEYGLPVSVEAAEYTIPGLVSALTQFGR